MLDKNTYKLITKNKKAYFDYEIIDSWEAWIELKWYEVKSVRNWYINLKWSYIVAIWEELFLKWANISLWKTLPKNSSIEADRVRKLFLKKKTIIYLLWKIKERWFSIIPLEVYFKWNLIKIKVALAKGKKAYQKKQVLKERAMDKQAKIMMKKYI